MRKYMMLFFLSISVVFSAFAQDKNFEALCKKYEASEQVETFGMDGLGVFLASLFVDEDVEGIGSLIKKCSSFRILTCEGQESEKLNKDVKAFIRSSKLEELINIQEDGQDIKIYVESKKNTVHQIFIAVVDGEKELKFIQVLGKFDMSVVRKLAKTTEISYLCP